jgi:hypothetical protein
LPSSHLLAGSTTNSRPKGCSVRRGSFLEELLAERIAADAARSPYEREVMNTEEAADFLRLSPTAFRRLAPSLPRCQIYERSGYRYLRSDLLTWL